MESGHMSVERNIANTASTCMEDDDFLNFMDKIEIDTPPRVNVTADEPPVLSKTFSKERDVDTFDGETLSKENEVDQDLVRPSDIIYADAPPEMVVTAEEPPVGTASLPKERDAGLSDGVSLAESPVLPAPDQDPCDTPSNEEERDEDLLGPSVTIHIDEPPGMVISAEEPSVGTTSLSKERDMGLSGGVLPAERQVPTTFEQDLCETPSNKEEKGHDLVELNGAIIEPAENMDCENICEGEHLENMRDWCTEKLSTIKFNEELKKRNQMMNSMNTVVSIYSYFTCKGIDSYIF